MTQPHVNPYQATQSTDLPCNPKPSSRRWLSWLVGGACVYYLLSAVTLPWVNEAWIGELPVLGLLQLPKAFIKSVIHDVLLYAVHQFGWSAGSPSPDYGMTHPWAMFFMCAAPASVLVLLVLYFSSGRQRVFFLIALVACAAIDAVVTLSFDASSSLKLYNGSFL